MIDHDCRNTTGVGLQYRNTEAFPGRREDKTLGRLDIGIEMINFLIEITESNVLGQAKGLRELYEFLFRWSFANDYAANLTVLFSKPLYSMDNLVNILIVQ